MIYLLRHGEIDLGGVFRLIGQSDLGLTELGMRQGRWWREELGERDWQAIYSSDLSRTRMFASLVSGTDEDQVRTVPELREILLGEWEGLTRADLQERYPREWEARGKDIGGYRPPGGESFADVQERAFAALEQIAARHSGDVLVVAHAGVNRVILCRLLAMDIDNLFELEQDYACLNLLKNNSGKLMAEAVNQPCGAV